jgi:hypothetical protein
VDSPNETDFADSDDEDGDIFELDAQGVIASKAESSPSSSSLASPAARFLPLPANFAAWISAIVFGCQRRRRR